MHKICFICFGDLLHRHSHNQTQTSQRWSIHWFARAFLGYVYNSYLLSKVLINKKKRKLEFFSTMTSSQCAHAIYTNVHLANYINKKSFPSGCVLNTASRTSNSAPHPRPPSRYTSHVSDTRTRASVEPPYHAAYRSPTSWR